MFNIPQGQPSTSRRCQAYTSKVGYLEFSISQEILSQGSYMNQFTRVNNLGALFICKVCTFLLANEQELLFACSHSWSALFLRNVPFDIVWDTFVLLEASTFLEVSRFSTIRACKFSSRLGSVMGIVPSFWTFVPVSSPAPMVHHICLRLGQDTLVYLYHL